MPLGENKLAVHLKDRLLKTWKQQRLELLESKWGRNLAAFKRDAAGDCEKIPWAKAKNHKPWHSTTVSDLTKTKVVAGKVAVCDIMLRGGKVQYLLQRDGDEAPTEFDAGQAPGENAPPELQPDGHALNATEIVEKHKALVDRQLEMCDAEGEFGLGVLYGAMVGETWVHTYLTTHEERRAEEIIPGTGIFDLIVHETSAPAVVNISPWEMFWDVEKGPKKGEGLCRVQYMSASELRDLKKVPLYIAPAINEVVKTSADKDGETPDGGADSQDPIARRRNNNRRRNIWVGEFQCRVPQSIAIAGEKALREKFPKAEFDFGEDFIKNKALGDDETDDDYTVEINCVMACDEIIRYARMESSHDRSYHRCIWEADPEGAGGISVADNVETETAIISKLTRALEDMCRICSRIILAGKRRLIDGAATIDISDPDSFLDLSEDVTDVRAAIQQLQITAPIGAIESALEYFMSVGDMASNIPRAQQGQEAGNPQTFSELRERLNRAGMYMGDVFRHYDELIEDVIEWFVQQNLTDPDQPLAKLPLKVRALGFASYMDRVVKLDAIYGLLDRILNNQTLQQLCNVKPLVQEAAKASDIEPTLFLKTNDELQEAATREQELLKAQQGDQRPSSGAEVQAQMAKVEALLAAVEKTRAETERIKEDITAKRAQTATQILNRGASQVHTVPAPEPQPTAELSPPPEPFEPATA